MFGKWKSQSNLRKGIEHSLMMSFFGIPEILVIHLKYEDFVRKTLIEYSHFKIRIVILILDSDAVCTDCASTYVKRLTRGVYPNAEGLVNVKYFGVPQSYVNEVTEKVASY